MKRAKVYIAGGIGLILLALIILGVAVLFKEEPFTTKFIAHRGHGYYDNTVEAFYNSKDYWGIECDVMVTRDKEFVLSHDDNFKDDNNTKISISNSTLLELQEVTFGGGYKICTFKEYLSICKKLNKVAIVEIKSKLSEDESFKLLEEIDSVYSRKKCNIISFDKETLLKFKNQKIELQLLFLGDIENNIEFCIENNINASMFFALIKIEDVEKLHKHKLKIGAWTVNSREECDKLISYGVDYITSDALYN